MTSFGSAIKNATSRSGFAVLTFLLATLLGAVAPPSLQSQISSLTTSLASPQCEGTAFNINATVTNRLTSKPGDGGVQGNFGNPAWPGMLAQNAGVNNTAVNNIVLGDDELSGEQNPVQFGGGDFEFEFYGELLNLSNDGFYISSNGFITFIDNNAATGIVPANPPALAAPNHTILIANVDIDPNAGGDIWWQVQNGPNGNVLVITFENIPYVNPFQANLANFQLLIYENGHAATPNRIEWRIDDLPQPGGVFGVIAGYENSCGTDGEAVYDNAAAAFAAIDNEAYTADPEDGPGLAAITIEYFDGAASMGSQNNNAPAGVSTNFNFAVPVGNRGVGNHTYSATVTYTYFNCVTETVSATATPDPFVVVANPTPAIPTVTSPACGNGTINASVTQNGANTYTWSQVSGPGGAVAAFTPNGTNAANSTTVSFNNALLAPGGTSIGIRVQEALTVAPFCTGNSPTRTFTAYRTPDQPVIAGNGANNGGINPPALPGAVGNPCAGTSRIYTAPGTAGTANGTTYWTWTVTNAAPGTSLGGTIVNGAGTATRTVNTNSGSITITWGNSTSDYTANLIVTASNGTGGSLGAPGSAKSCAGLPSAVTAVYVNGVSATATVTPNIVGPVCENDTRTYTVPLTAGSTYNWTVTNGIGGAVPGANYTLVTGAAPNNNSATIDWNIESIPLPGGTYRVNCTETTSGGCVTVHTFATVVVNPIPMPTLNNLSGTLNQCTYIGGPIQNGQNLAEYQYQVVPDNANNRFDWTVTNGIFLSTNTSSISNITAVGANATQTVRWTSAGVQTVAVTETIVATGCALTATIDINVVASPTPKTITGPGYNTGLAGNPCANTGPHNYAINLPVGGNTYTWSIVGGGGAIVGPNTGTSVNINWGAAGTRTIRVEEQGPAPHSCVTERTFQITVNPLPNGTIPANVQVCNGNNVVYTYTPGGNDLPGATYLWTVAPPSVIVGPNNGSSVTINGSTPGPGVGNAAVTLTVTNPGIGACALNLNGNVQIVPTTSLNPAGVPSPICVGGQYTFTGNSSGYPGGGVVRTWSFSITPNAAYTGSAPLSTSFISNTASANWANVTIGDSSLADVLAGGDFDLSISYTDVLGAASCPVGPQVTNVTVNPRPVRPTVDFVSPVCNLNVPTNYTITNYDAGLTYAVSGPAGFAATVGVPNPNNIQVTAWGAAGNKTINVDATDVTGCTRRSVYAITVVATPTNPQPAPVTIQAVCVDSGYFDNAAAINATIGAPVALSPAPTRVITYSAPAPLAGHWYQWYVTNGFIVEAGNSVGQFNTAQLNATTVDVVWTGPNPGKVKYLVFTSDPNNPPPAPCFATSIEPTVNLPIIPDVPLTFTTSSDQPGDKVCEGNPVTLTLSGSKVGLDYRVEEWNGATWSDIGVTPVAGTGGAINLVVPASVLDIVSSPTTDHTFRFTAKDNTFAPGVNGPCEWLRTATDVITITVFDTPDDKPVVVNSGLSVGGGVFAVCEGDNVLIDVQNTQNFVQYSLERRQIFPVAGAFAPVPASAQLGTGGTITLIDNTTAGIGTGGALLNVNNYEWRVSALIPPAPLNPPAGGCQVYMTQTGQVRVFDLPVDPTVTFSPNPVCWEENITVNLANTEAGVEYEVLNNGNSLTPQVILQGTGGAVNGQFNSAWILPANPNVSQVVNNVYVEARLVQNGTYTRPIPTSTCPQDYGNANIEVLEKPVASISGPAVVCGPSTADYVGAPVTPSPISTYDWELMAPIFAGVPVATTPLSATNTGNGTVNPFTVNWGVNNLSCNGDYNPASQEIRMIVTNNNNCADTAFITVTIEPTVYDAAIIGDNTACIYGGYEEHLKTYSIQRPDPCVYPVGTTFFWEMPTGTVSGAIRSGQFTETIIAEWHTTGGSGIGTVTATVTLPVTHGGCSTTRTLDVAVYPLPVPAINGPASVCQGQQNVAYTADNYPTDHYYWSVIGGTIDLGTGTGVVGDTARRDGVGVNTISIDWNDTPNPNAFVRLKQVSAQGCMEVTDFAVVVNPTPTPVINGADVACDNSVYTYNTADNAPNNTYQWTITSGNATITGGANQAAATVLTGDIGGGNAFTIQLTETVLATNCTKTVSKNVTIVEKPNPTITRIAPAGGAVGGACLNQTITYGNTDPVAGVPNYSYKWSVSNGTIVGSDEANTLQVTWNTVGAGTVTLMKWHTGSQCTTTVSQTVNIVDTPAPTISGPTTVCGESEHEYSTPFVAGNTYSWMISGNGAFTGGQMTNAAMVEFVNPTPGNQLSATLTVTETNTLSGCTSNAQLVVTINYQPQTVTITRVSPAGPANQACNNSTIVYSVPNNTGSSYGWSVTGGTIVSGGTSNQVTVQWTNVGTQTLTVVETNAQGDCSATSTLNVGVTYQPVPAISGNSTVCTGDVVTYSTPDVPGSTYLWSLPSAGGTILTGVNSNQMTVEWILSGTRTVQVVETNGNCTATATLSVTIGKTPTSTDISRVTPVGNVAVACVNQVITYSTPNNGTSQYEWTVTGGNIVGSNTANTVVVEWTTIGNQTLTVVETTAGTDCSKTDVQNISVEDQPNPSIAGPTVVCTDDVSTYSVTAVGGHSYNWSINGGGTIVTGTTASSIDVEWTTAGTHTITVTQSNATGNCTATTTLDVNVGQTPIQTVIAGNATVCNGSNEVYSVTAIGGQSYVWTITGGTIVSGQGTNAITVQWTQIGSQTVDVEISTNGTNCTTDLSLNVTVEFQPAPAISGNATVCTGEIETYSTPANAGSTYAWSVTGGTITSGTGSNEIMVEWQTAGAQTVTVTETNASGNCSATTTLDVNVGQTPIQTSIAGDATVCNGSNEVYSVTAIGGQSYVWTITGGTIVSGQGTNAITVQWTQIGSQTVDVEISTNGTNCSKDLSLNVTVEFQPAPAISGDAVVCLNDVETYSTPANAGSTYAWTVIGGTITSGANSNEATIEWTSVGTQTVTVTETNASGNCSATATLNVDVNDKPNTTEITRNDGGNVDHACEGYTYEYGTNTANPANYEFEWTVTGGQFENGNTTPTVDVKWTQVGSNTLTVTVTTPGTDCEVTVTQNVSVTPTPQPNINGATISCINKDHVYQTPYVAGNTYEWEITPANVFAPITGYPNSNVIEVKWIQPGLHTMTLTETNVAGGCATTVSINVQVNEIPDPFIYTSGDETGYGNPKERRPGIVCNFSTHMYATAYDPTPGSGNAGNTFIWTVTGGTIIAGQYTNEIEVTWGPAGIGTIAVEETVPGSDCITSVLDSIDIRPTPSPVVSGNINPCVNSTEQYTTPFVAGNSWNWDVTGGTIVSGQGTNTIRVQWNTTNWPNTIAGSVKVTEWVTDVLPSMSCINDNTLNTTVRPAPPTPDINGDFEVCATDLNTTPSTDNITTYFTTPPAQNINVQGVVTYQWSVSNNGEIVGSSNGSSVNVRWYNNGTTPTNGSITIRLTSNFGCTSQTSQTVTINPIPQPDINGPTSVCHNSLHTYSTPGFPGHQYDWTVTGGNVIRSGQGTPNVTVEWTVTGTYTLTVSETNTYGCEVENTINVTVNELPNATITASGPTTFCQGGDVTLTAPLGYASYVWSTGETARSIVVRTSGEYWVIVTDENGCSNNSDTITVNVFPSSLPIITVSGPTTFCEGGSVTLTAPAGFDAYLWSTGETTQSITVTESGSYTVTVADNNGCTGTSTEVDVFVNPKPSPVLTVVGSTTVCSGDSVEVRAPLGYVSYTWVSTSGNNYGTERSIFVTQTDTIYCQVVDANGCVGESDTVIITVSPVIDPVITPNGPTEFCEGGSVKLSAPEGFATYFWSNGATTREIVVEDGGDYSVTVTNGAACESASAPTNVMVYALPARPSISRTGDVLKAESAVAEAYQWYRNGVMIPGANEVTLLVNQPGTYRVEIADNNTCSSISDGFDVILTSVDDDVVAGRQALTIFPNPTNGQFTIEGEISVAGNVSIELVNMVGEIVMTQNAFSNGGLFTKSMDMGTLASGVYNVIVTSENERWTIRLVRQ